MSIIPGHQHGGKKVPFNPPTVKDECPRCGMSIERSAFAAVVCPKCGRTTARNCENNDDFHEAVKEAVERLRGMPFFRNKSIYRELIKMGYKKESISVFDVSSAMRYHSHEIPGLVRVRELSHGYYTWEDMDDTSLSPASAKNSRRATDEEGRLL